MYSLTTEIRKIVIRIAATTLTIVIHFCRFLIREHVNFYKDKDFSYSVFFFVYWRLRFGGKDSAASYYGPEDVDLLCIVTGRD